MSPQLLWTIAGLILTVLTLGAVSITAFQSTDAATAKLIAAESSNVATAMRMWAAANVQDPADAYNGVDAAKVQRFIPDLELNEAGDYIKSKAMPGAVYGFNPNGDTGNGKPIGDKATITLENLPNDELAVLLTQMTAKNACPADHDDQIPNVVFWECSR